MQRLSRPIQALMNTADRRLYQRNMMRTGFAFARANALSTRSLSARRPFSATTAAPADETPQEGDPAGAAPGEAKAGDKRSALASLKMKKIQAQRQQFKDDAEVDFYSIPGVLVMVVAAGMAYGLYTVDQAKHEGISWFKGSITASCFAKRNTLEDFLKFRKEHDHKSMDKDITAPEIIFEHLLNYLTFKGNEEGIYSKFYRWVSLPEPPLLPPLKTGAQVMRTLVIDVDTVIHSSWQRETYFERKPRPLYAEFMWKMAQCGYEIVLWSQEEQLDWEEDMQKLDPNGLGAQMLWNKDIYYYNSHKCKNLRWLNRKMKNVILLDSNPRSAQLQPENAVILTPWRGDNKNDTELSDVSDFLSYIAMADVQDVREVLKSYEGKHIPSAFKEQYIQTLQQN